MRARIAAIAGAVLLMAVAPAAPASPAAHWSRPAKVTGVKRLLAVSCASRSFCMAVGGGQAVAYRSGKWRPPQTIDSHSGINDGLVTVSCVSATFCAAGDGVGNVFTYNGRSWSSPTSVATTGLSRLSCATTQFCGAVDIVGDAILYDGSSWSSPRRIPGASQPQLISCPVFGFCMATDVGSSAYRLSAGQWVHAGTLRTSNPQGGSEPDIPSAVSCSGRHFCAALDDFGEAFTWNGSHWSRPHRFDANLLAGSDAVSCRTKTACMAVDGNGVAASWNGTMWSRKQSIDPGAGVMDVSCAAARFCVAIDIRAHALIYR
jgi:hypothetical protein